MASGRRSGRRCPWSSVSGRRSPASSGWRGSPPSRCRRGPCHPRSSTVASQMRIPHQLVGHPEVGPAAALLRWYHRQLLVPVVHTETVGESAAARQALTLADEHGEEVAEGVTAADTGGCRGGRRRPRSHRGREGRPQERSRRAQRTVAGEPGGHRAPAEHAGAAATADQTQNSQQQQRQRRR